MTQEEAFQRLIDDIVMAVGGEQVGTGFYQVFCPMCGNKGIKKGGFKFESDKIIYNCFRGKCDASCVYEKGNFFPRKMLDVLSNFSVKVPVELRTGGKRPKALTEVLDEDLFKKNSFTPIKLPKELKPLPIDHVWHDYIEERHLMDADFLIAESGKYRGCLAIPIRFDGSVVGIQYITKKTFRYIKETGGNANLIFSPTGKIADRIFVVEGFLDALSLPNMVAVMGPTITPEKAYHINRAKEVIVIPDRRNSKLFDSAKKYGWKVSIPGWRVNDVNEAVMKYGRLIASKMIHDGICESGGKTFIRYEHWTRI